MTVYQVTPGPALSLGGRTLRPGKVVTTSFFEECRIQPESLGARLRVVARLVPPAPISEEPVAPSPVESPKTPQNASERVLEDYRKKQLVDAAALIGLEVRTSSKKALIEDVLAMDALEPMLDALDVV